MIHFSEAEFCISFLQSHKINIENQGMPFLSKVLDRMMIINSIVMDKQVAVVSANE